MARWQHLAACALIALVPVVCAAEPRTTYEITLTVASVEPGGLPDFKACDDPSITSRPDRYFGCVDAGDTFRGRFSVDTSILGLDGLNSTAAIYDFYLPFGAGIYSTGPDNTMLSGFRNPGFGAAAPSFLIAGGQVVDLLGGVYAAADWPTIDFSAHSFFADDLRSHARGSFVITPIPEPETLAMWLLGTGLLALAVRRRRP